MEWIINFENFMFKNACILYYFLSQNFILRMLFYFIENFHITINDIINVEAAKVLWRWCYDDGI